jgi:uncharacterized protein (TIGR00251 family)
MDVRVRVTTRASRDELAGTRDSVLLVRVKAPPVDGKANAAVCKLIAKALGIGPTRVEVVRGHSSRDKTVSVEAVEESAARAALGLAVEQRGRA